jgi:hypothetical protein
MNGGRFVEWWKRGQRLGLCGGAHDVSSSWIMVLVGGVGDL